MRRVSSLIACGLLMAGAPGFTQPNPASTPATLQPDEDEHRGYEASVGSITELRNQGSGENDLSVHLYGTAGGDPAMNGLYTYIAFYQSPAEGHRVFRIGDFNAYRLVSEAKGRIVLEVDENIMNDSTGEIGSRTRRMAVSWTPPADGTAPQTLSVAAAP